MGALRSTLNVRWWLGSEKAEPGEDGAGKALPAELRVLWGELCSPFSSAAPDVFVVLQWMLEGGLTWSCTLAAPMDPEGCSAVGCAEWEQGRVGGVWRLLSCPPPILLGLHSQS